MKNSPLIPSVEFCSSHEWVPPIGGYAHSNDAYRQLSTPSDGYRQSKTEARFRYTSCSLRRPPQPAGWKSEEAGGQWSVVRAPWPLSPLPSSLCHSKNPNQSELIRGNPRLSEVKKLGNYLGV